MKDRAARPAFADLIPLTVLAVAAAGLLVLAWPQSVGAQPWGYPYGRRWGPPQVVVPPGPPTGEYRRYPRQAYGRWWPGQVLPPDAPAVLITDYGRYHLRVPPRGYVWLLCEGDLLLASIASRQIFEVIPYGSY